MGAALNGALDFYPVRESYTYEQAARLCGAVALSAVTVLASYKSRLVLCRENLQQAQNARLRSLVIAISASLVAAACLGLCLFLQAKAFAVFALPAGYAAFYFFMQYRRAGNKWASLDAQCDYFERGIGRLTNTWEGVGNPGADYAKKSHLYQEDLNVLGAGSLFELLCTTRSHAGASRLAACLLAPVTLEETQWRQQCVRELRDVPQLREQLHQFGSYSFENCSETDFED